MPRAQQPSDPIAVARLVAEIGDRGPGTDAERRAARLLARELRARGREARTETVWVRPQFGTVHALIAAVGVAATVVSVDAPLAALVMALAALAAFVADLTAGAPLLRRITRERATQNVISPPRPPSDAALPARHRGRRSPAAAEPPRVRLVVAADVDAPRAGLLERLRVPAPFAIVFAALAATAAGTAARYAEVEGAALGIAQLVPSIVLILAVGAFLDAAVASPARGAAAASGPAAALALADALDAAPPRHMGVELVLAGAGSAQALGMRAYVRARRREGVRGEDVVVLHLGPCGAGRPRWWVREGLVAPLAAHRRLRELAAACAAAEERLNATATASATRSAAWAARVGRWPALRLGADGPVGGDIDGAALAATVELAVALVRAVDRELGATVR